MAEKRQLSPRLRPQQSPPPCPRVRWLLRAKATEWQRATLVEARKKTLAYMFTDVTVDTIFHVALPKGHLKSREFSTAQKGRVSTNCMSVSTSLVTKRLMEDLRQPCLLFIRLPVSPNAQTAQCTTLMRILTRAWVSALSVPPPPG